MPARATKGRLSARRQGVGAGGARDFAPTADTLSTAPELVLAGRRAISGELVDPAGHPIDRGTVWLLSREKALRADDRLEEIEGWFLERRDEVAEHQHEGLLIDRETARDGRFHFAGIGPGSFLVVALHQGQAFVASVGPGQDHVRLRVPRRRLRVRLLGLEPSELERLHIALLPLHDETGLALDREDRLPERHSAADAEVDFEVRGGWSYRVVVGVPSPEAHGADFADDRLDMLERELRIDEHDFLRELELRLSARPHEVRELWSSELFGKPQHTQFELETRTWDGHLVDRRRVVAQGPALRLPRDGRYRVLVQPISDPELPGPVVGQCLRGLPGNPTSALTPSPTRGRSNARLLWWQTGFLLPREVRMVPLGEGQAPADLPSTLHFIQGGRLVVFARCPSIDAEPALPPAFDEPSWSGELRGADSPPRPLRLVRLPVRCPGPEQIVVYVSEQSLEPGAWVWRGQGSAEGFSAAVQVGGERATAVEWKLD